MLHRINKIRELMVERNLEALIIDSNINIFYLSGFTGTAARILFTPDDNYFITDFRYKEQAEQQTEGYQIIEINNNVEADINEILQEENINKVGFEAAEISYHQFEKYDDKLAEIELVPTRDLVQQLRLIKEGVEVDQIKKAVEITDQAFNHILSFLRPGITEKDVDLELDYFMKKKGGDKRAFDFIVASGKRSSLPHGVASDKKLQKGDLVTMDFGTIYRGYCSDITRTIVLGNPTSKQRKIYNIVLKAQKRVVDEIKAGLTGKEADSIARVIINEAGYKDNFGHGLGHGLGLEVHENPRVSYKAETELKSGMVVTNEPGIYIEDWGGVRIEDDLLLTEDGCEVLSTSNKELIIL